MRSIGLAPRARSCYLAHREVVHPQTQNHHCARVSELSPVTLRTYEGIAERREEIASKVEEFDPASEFFNETIAPSSAAVAHERPEHMRIINLKFAGHTNIEISAFTGYTPNYISMLLRQPWARKRLLTMFEQDGQNLAKLVEAEAKQALMVLAEIRDDEKAPANARVTASINLMDRFFGKPTQRIETFDSREAATLDNVQNLDAEIAKQQEELKRLEGSK
jgi:hypothetical protein